MKRLGIFFGSAWCALGLIIGTMMFLDANKNDWDLVTIIVMLLIWELIGIPFLCFPVAKMISDKKTDKNIDESDIKEQNKKQLKRFVNVIAIFAVVMVIIIVVFLING